MADITLMEVRPINKDGIILITERQHCLRDSFSFRDRDEARRAVMMIAAHYGWYSLVDIAHEELTATMGVPAKMLQSEEFTSSTTYKSGDKATLNGEDIIINVVNKMEVK